ncbi:TetR/AcrR family transcriptional regulator [Mesorhizobium sp. SP-1A]|uniref:TetR/AcrR family transcriptional regulator n=1 Tax=Mesorhizobium sp. SP-1A TaxID=3077840 RepID=UPI0028F7259E|nr:TetR/AcrR family transcriptional regulator [Mesorhizobium sp. SP-1A]
MNLKGPCMEDRAQDNAPQYSQQPRSTRLSGEDRREDIVSKAMVYFADHGFAGGTRELAKKIGVTQPLLYKHFSSKAELIQAVFDRLAKRQRDAHWDILLKDRAKPIEARMVSFFSAYSEYTYTYEWIRLYTFAGLSDGSLNVWHIQRVGNPLMTLICLEVGAEAGLTRNSDQITQDELDVMWILHGGLFYFYVRKFVYGEFPQRTFEFPIRQGVKQALASLRAIYSNNP